MKEFFDNIFTNAADWVPNILIALAIFVGSILLARIISRLLHKALTKRDGDPEVALLLSRITKWSILAAGTLAALQRFFDVTAFLAGLGIMGFTIGFALQDIMKNFVAGIILLIQQPFNVGDAIEVSDYGGSVLAINLRTTEMQTWDGRIVIIPNADVLSNVITNYTRADRRRIDIPVGVAYGTDLDLAKATILQAVKNIPGFIVNPAPSVISDTFGDSAINLTAYFWIDTKKIGLFDAKDAGVRVIKAALDQKQIDIPFPIRTVYMQNADQ